MRRLKRIYAGESLIRPGNAVFCRCKTSVPVARAAASNAARRGLEWAYIDRLIPCVPNMPSGSMKSHCMSTKINAVCAGSTSSVNTSFPSIVIISNHFLRVIRAPDRGNLFGGSSAVVPVQQDTGQNPSSDHYRHPIVGEQLTGSGHRIVFVNDTATTE